MQVSITAKDDGTEVYVSIEQEPPDRIEAVNGAGGVVLESPSKIEEASRLLRNASDAAIVALYGR